MGKKATAGEGGNTAAAGAGSPVAGRKPKRAADMRVVRVAQGGDGSMALAVLDKVANLKAGNASIDMQMEPGKYAVITFREVREITVQPVSRKATL